MVVFPFGLRSLPFLFLIILLAGGSLLLSACGDGNPPPSRPTVDSTDTRSHDLMALVDSDPQLQTLREALETTATADMLQAEGPFTLFAPTDAAFRNQWPAFDTLLETTHRDTLHELLRLHIVRGRLQATADEDTLHVSSLSQYPLTLQRTRQGSLQIEGHPISRTLEAHNGVLHLIPAVLQPAPPDTARQEDDFELPVSDSLG